MTGQAAFNFENYIGKARALKAKIEEIKDKHKAELEPFNAAYKKVGLLILDALNQSGQQNTTTISGGAHKKERRSCSLENPEEFQRHVVGTEAWDLVNWAANITAVDAFLAENATLPPGVKLSVMVDVGYTAPTKKNAAKKSTTPQSNPSLPAPVGDGWDEAEALAQELASASGEGEGEAE